jgi:hypothetical protein
MRLHCRDRLVRPYLLGHWPCYLRGLIGGPRQLAP